MSNLKPEQTVKENCVRCYMKRTKKYRLWFQAASELIKEERKYEQGHFLQKPLVGVFEGYLSCETVIALLPQVWHDN